MCWGLRLAFCGRPLADTCNYVNLRVYGVVSLIIETVWRHMRLVCHQAVSSSDTTIDAAVRGPWKTVNEQEDENPTSETLSNSIIQILGEIGLFTLFKVLTCLHGCQRRIWSHSRQLSPPWLIRIRRKNISYCLGCHHHSRNVFRKVMVRTDDELRRD